MELVVEVFLHECEEGAEIPQTRMHARTRMNVHIYLMSAHECSRRQAARATPKGRNLLPAV